MAIRKTTKKIVSVKPPVKTPQLFWQLCVIVVALVIALTYFWLHLPKRQGPVNTQVPIAQTPNQQQRLTCEKAGGKWTDCGNPCHGQDVESCVAMCEPQCLCGGAPGYSCPVNTVCSDRLAAKPGEVGIGVCRDKVEAIQVQKPKTTIMATVDASVYPFIVTGSVSGTGAYISWAAYSEGMPVGSGVFASGNMFSEKLFLQSMPSSTNLTFDFEIEDFQESGNGYLTNKTVAELRGIKATSTLLSPMTRTRYWNGPDAQDYLLTNKICPDPQKQPIVIPKTNLPFEATLRVAIPDILSVKISNGTAEITVLGLDECFTKTLAEAIAKEFPAVKSVVIKERSAQTQP